jgi:hypothetical protein
LNVKYDAVSENTMEQKKDSISKMVLDGIKKEKK